MRMAVEPYLEEHARFDRWARRLSLGDAAFREPGALEEAAFAPLRERRLVRAAWIVREGPDARELRYPEGGPELPDGGWVPLRLDREGDYTARRATLEVEGEARELTLLRSSRPATGDATLHVTLGFGPPS